MIPIAIAALNRLTAVLLQHQYFNISGTENKNLIFLKLNHIFFIEIRNEKEKLLLFDFLSVEVYG